MPQLIPAASARDALELYCRERDYKGFCKFDALNSPLLERICGDIALLRLLSTQAVNRLPLPMRQLTGVIPRRNPKGIANFIRGYAAQLKASPTDEIKAKVRALADWLLANDSGTLGAYQGPGRCWGYSFPWQSPAFYAPRHSPNCIVTTFCAEALLDAYDVLADERYLAAALDASKYILETLPRLESDADNLCIGYVHTQLNWKVINVNSVASGFLARLSRRTDQARLSEAARRMIHWVLGARDPGQDSWSYTWPKEQSGIGPDNYHTGGILDGIHDTWVSLGGPANEAQKQVYLSALRFYEERFFTAEGGPKWRVERDYPMDIHGAAQGILTFVRASRWDPAYLDVARRIADWSIATMRDPSSGRFYYQRWPGFTWKIDLMRWNNSWMFRALSSLVYEVES